MTKRTTVFQSGNSQAVRIPADFRLDVSSVEIRRQGSDLILSPVDEGWPKSYFSKLEKDPADPSFERQSQTRSSKRETL